MLVAVLAIVVLAGMSGAILTTTLASNDEQDSATDQIRSIYLAESGLSHAISNLTAGNDTDIATADAPLDFSNGSYFVDLTDNADGTYTVVATGATRTATRTIEAILTPVGGGVFNNAVFAGNTSNDPGYTMTFGGCATQADDIQGDVYSGGNVEVTCDATITGDIEADGTITGDSGTEGATQPVPDLQSMDYANNNDFDVAAMFAADEFWSYDAAGGYAYQVRETNPAHIFRKNPTDRSSNVNSTVKDDYFLEDPYEPVTIDSGSTGADAYQITLTGVAGEAGTSSNNSVFYIDGNLWVHNYKTFSLKLMSDTGNGGTQVTFVVSGNIYFSDNVFYEDPDLDGIAFIAMEDSNVEDSGNIYFGDPEFGTLEYMDSYMYAENNFYDNNLDASASADVTIHGNMSAGNHVSINRDWEDQHSKLTTIWDPRIAEETIEMPGLPTSLVAPNGWAVASWREIANP